MYIIFVNTQEVRPRHGPRRRATVARTTAVAPPPPCSRPSPPRRQDVVSKSIKAREEWVHQAFIAIMAGISNNGGFIPHAVLPSLRPKAAGKPTGK